jgi:glucose-6-phosphate isomerase
MRSGQTLRLSGESAAIFGAFMNTPLQLPPASWDRFQQFCFSFPDIGLSVDLSRTSVTDKTFGEMKPAFDRAFRAMDDLEAGAIANPDENRMVGHYWLRAPEFAPDIKIREEITSTLARIKEFAAKVHGGDLKGAGGTFRRLLVIGIGGSALGPQFVARALGHPSRDRMLVHFFDNTDPDGMEKVLAEIGPELDRTLAVVISKSGGTPETRNGMLVAKAAYEKAGAKFHEHAVAITGKGSSLDKFASEPEWLARFPMWDWVGGRTSETSAVGLVPALLQGVDIDNVLAGAATCDRMTRPKQLNRNPAALLALAWFVSVNGKGERDMVILPYKDRLELLSRYLQQLIMESLGKEKDLDGKVVHQGIAVYGNKGSTDQHAYIQQLRDGTPNFFATFIEVLKDNTEDAGVTSIVVDLGNTTGDYLKGFFLGTRDALFESGRASVTLTVREVSAFTVGMLIALYERAVGFYASLVNVNAYHQPGVEAGKKAAASVLELKGKILEFLPKRGIRGATAEELATELKTPERAELIYKICEHLSANGRVKKNAADWWAEGRYYV